MSHRDEFNELVEKGEFKKAAEAALWFSAGCGSKNGAWSWAEDAIRALENVSAEAAEGMKNALGQASWPKLEAGEEYLKSLP